MAVWNERGVLLGELAGRLAAPSVPMQLIATAFAACINVSAEMIIKACKNLDFIWIYCGRVAYSKAAHDIF
jgi:hypothetical protein